MSPNSDNAMARFLFAILKQKNLKDIDWTLVAEDPVLMQPITNGHAARMRYSRFRSTILGHEPQKRNRTVEKSRVSKSKKDSYIKKEGIIKSESSVSLSSYAQFSPASMTSPYINDTKDDFSTRFLTPCSDDMTQGIPVQRGFASNMDYNSEFMNGHDGSLAGSPAFSAFDAAYDLSSYSGGSGDLQNQDPRDLSGHLVVPDCGNDWSDRFHDQPLF